MPATLSTHFLSDSSVLPDCTQLNHSKGKSHSSPSVRWPYYCSHGLYELHFPSESRNLVHRYHFPTHFLSESSVYSQAKQNKCYVSCYMPKKIRVGRSEIIIIL